MRVTAMIDTPAGIAGAEQSQSRALPEVEAVAYKEGKALLEAEAPEGFQMLRVRVVDPV